MLANPHQKYQQSQVETSSPAKLLLMLYDGALKSIQGARVGMMEKDYEKANQHLTKAQDIIFELMSSLDLEVGEVAQNLYLLYDYMIQQLVQSNIKKDPQILTQVESLLKDLRETWKEAVLKA